MRAVAIIAFLGFMTLTTGALAETAEEKAAQRQWKSINKVELKKLNTAIRSQLDRYEDDLESFFADLDQGTDPYLDGPEILTRILHDLYSGVEAAVEDAVENLDVLGSTLLATFDPPLGTLQDFGPGDGGTLDKSVATIRKQLAKVDRAVIKSAKRIKREVSEAQPGETRYTITVYPMPLAFMPAPRGDESPIQGLMGSRPSVFLAAIGVSDYFSATSSYVGMADFTGGLINLKDGSSTVANVAVSPDANGIHSSNPVASVSAPTTIGWRYDPLGDDSGQGQAIYAGARSPLPN